METMTHTAVSTQRDAYLRMADSVIAALKTVKGSLSRSLIADAIAHTQCNCAIAEKYPHYISEHRQK